MKSCLLITLISCIFCFKGFTQKSVIDSLQQIIYLGKSDKAQARAMNKLANEYVRTDVEKAKTILYEVISLGKALKDERTLSTSYSNLITIHQNRGTTDSAVYYLALLQRLSDDATGPEMNIIKENFNSTAGLFYKKSGNPKLALSYFKETVRLSEKDDDKVATAGQLLNYGNTYRDLGDYKNALLHHLKALKYFEDAGHKRGISFCYQSISNSFAELKQYENALKYSRKAIHLKTELKDKRGLGTAQDGLGNIYLSSGKYDKAIQHFTASLTISRDLKLVTEQSKTYFNIGKTYAAKKDIKAAIENFNQSKLMAMQLGDSSTSSAVDLELLTLQKNESLQETEKKIIKSLHTFTQTGDRIKEAAGYKKLAGFYSSKGDHEMALRYTNLYIGLNDSIQNNELQLQFKKMEEQYIVEKKENEITLLKKDQQLNAVKLEKQKAFQYAAILILLLIVLIGFGIINRYRVIQKAKRQIEIEKMRNNIARDLHDDIGSTITSINILSNVLLTQKNDGKIIQSNIQKITDNSALIMESMGDIVWAINPQNDSLEKIIYRMREFAAEILEPLNIKFDFKTSGDITSAKLDPSKRRDLYMIFKETLNNAARYSGCSLVEITVNFTKKILQMNITDNGHGFNETITRKGNGICNIRERAKEMNASLNFQSKVGEGTSVNLNLPLT